MGNLKDTFKKPQLDFKLGSNETVEEILESPQTPAQEAVQEEAPKKAIKYDNLNSRVERDTKEWLDKYVRDIKDAQGKKVVKQEELVQLALEMLQYQNIDPAQISSLDDLKSILKNKNLLPD